MEQTFLKKKLEKYAIDCHESAMGFIEIVSNAAIDQMKVENNLMNPEDVTPEIMVAFASRHLYLDYDELLANYIDMMVLEKMVEIVREIQAN